MKITTHRCDLCGAKRAPKLLCKLTVPLTEEDKQLRAKVGNPNREIASPYEAFHARYAFMMGAAPPDGSTGATVYDICRECVDGILAARFREVRRKLALED